MTKKTPKIRTKVRAGAISTTPGGTRPGSMVNNHNVRPTKAVKPTAKLAAKRVRGVAARTGARSGAFALDLDSIKGG